MCVKVCVFDYLTMEKNILGYLHALSEWLQGRRGRQESRKEKGKGEVKYGTKKIPSAYMNLSCLCIFEYICVYVERNNRKEKYQMLNLNS